MNFNKVYWWKLYIVIVFTTAGGSDWVEIPQMNPYSAPSKFAGTIYYSGTKTPVNITFRKEQIDNLEADNITYDYEEHVTEENIKQRQKMYINETLTSSTTEIFTDLETEMFSDETNLKMQEYTQYDESIEEVADELPADNTKKDNSFGNNEDVLPFLKYIQSSLLNKVHKDLKSKIKVLKDLRDNLMINIDRRLKTIWTSSEPNQARDYKDDSHIEFPSNEGALMTIGFLTLAVFLVKLVLQVIHAIKAKKMYYNATMNMMNMNTAATLLGRKKRFVTLDEQTTYDILRSIQNLKYN